MLKRLLKQLKNRVSSERLDSRIEIASVVLLFFATTASAWSSYQAAVWSDNQVLYIGEMSKANADAIRLSALSDQMMGIDAGMFQMYYAALAEGKKSLADGIFRRFRPEMKIAVEAWLATNPFKNPNAPQGPMVMKEYTSAARREAKEKSELRDQLFEKAKSANTQSANYVRVNMLFAPLIFIGGVLPQFHLRGIRLFILAFGFSVFFITMFRLLTFPVIY